MDTFATASHVTCACGQIHHETGHLKPLGWTTIGPGGQWGAMVRCDRCAGAMCVALIHNAVACCTCKRLVLGAADDPKLITDDGLVRCSGCARRDGLHLQPAMIFRAWVQSGDPRDLSRWRELTGRRSAA